VSRNPQKLSDVEKEIKSVREGCKVLSITFDFSKEHQQGYEKKIFEAVKDLDLSIVVNNAGLLDPGTFSTKKVDTTYDQLRINCYHPLIMT